MTRQQHTTPYTGFPQWHEIAFQVLGTGVVCACLSFGILGTVGLISLAIVGRLFLHRRSVAPRFSV